LQTPIALRRSHADIIVGAKKKFGRNSPHSTRQPDANTTHRIGQWIRRDERVPRGGLGGEGLLQTGAGREVKRLGLLVEIFFGGSSSRGRSGCHPFQKRLSPDTSSREKRRRQDRGCVGQHPTPPPRPSIIETVIPWYPRCVAPRSGEFLDEVQKGAVRHERIHVHVRPALSRSPLVFPLLQNPAKQAAGLLTNSPPSSTVSSISYGSMSFKIPHFFTRPQKPFGQCPPHNDFGATQTNIHPTEEAGWGTRSRAPSCRSSAAYSTVGTRCAQGMGAKGSLGSEGRGTGFSSPILVNVFPSFPSFQVNLF